MLEHLKKKKPFVSMVVMIHDASMIWLCCCVSLSMAVAWRTFGAREGE